MSRNKALQVLPADPAGLVVLERFILAIRDAGYRGTGAALAELIDNAFEADASSVAIEAGEGNDGLVIDILDDGHGMTPEILRLALRFGGSSRFGSRSGAGRYGMGLPNSSVSQARRLEVFTRRNRGATWWAYLDIDEVVAGALVDVPWPARSEPTVNLGSSGTLVRWSKCDRLDCTDWASLKQRLIPTLGRIFRHHLWQGKRLTINGESVLPSDPLYVRDGSGLSGASLVGPPLEFDVRARRTGISSTIRVLFSRLPVDAWEPLPSSVKRSAGVTKSPGISIVRAGREIDTGWFFMGKKRKENYDDWWRCEVQFEPVLDELFGVTHTKQGIHPTDHLTRLLTPDLECIAHQLNAETRRCFQVIRSRSGRSRAGLLAEKRDHTLEPPIANQNGSDQRGSTRLKPSPSTGMRYRIEKRPLEELSFFRPIISSGEVLVLLNTSHPFYERVYRNPVAYDPRATSWENALELVLFAAARAEGIAGSDQERRFAERLRTAWSNALAAFLS
jgi:hypothetical protein